MFVGFILCFFNEIWLVLSVGPSEPAGGLFILFLGTGGAEGGTSLSPEGAEEESPLSEEGTFPSQGGEWREEDPPASREMEEEELPAPPVEPEGEDETLCLPLLSAIVKPSLSVFGLIFPKSDLGFGFLFSLFKFWYCGFIPGLFFSTAE